jgi:hypothetical protein
MARRGAGGRSRNANGRFRAKRSDTHVGTVERTYRRNLGGRSDKHLGTLLKEAGKGSQSELLGH